MMQLPDESKGFWYKYSVLALNLNYCSHFLKLPILNHSFNYGIHYNFLKDQKQVTPLDTVDLHLIVSLDQTFENSILVNFI